jgi:hypothetical protein
VAAGDTAEINPFTLAHNTVTDFFSAGIQITGNVTAATPKFIGTIGGASDVDGNTVSTTFQGVVGIRMNIGQSTRGVFSLGNNTMTVVNGNNGLLVVSDAGADVDLTMNRNVTNNNMTMQAGGGGKLRADLNNNTAVAAVESSAFFLEADDTPSTFFLVGSPTGDPTPADIMMANGNMGAVSAQGVVINATATEKP